MDNNIGTAAAHGIPARVVRQSLRRVIWAGTVGMSLYTACVGIPYMMLLDRFGASGTVQGLASAITQVSVFAQIPGAFVVETLRRRKVFWLAVMFAHRALWFTPAIVVWLMDFGDARALNIILMAAAISSLLNNFPDGAWYSWLADLVPKPIRGRFWTDRQVALSVTSVVTALAWGALLDRLGAVDARLGFSAVFALAAAGGVAGLVIHGGVAEPAPVREPLGGRFWTGVWERVSGPMLHPGFRGLALAMGVWTFACAVPGPFGWLFLKGQYGLTYSTMAVMSVAGALGMMAVGKGFGYLMDRLGARAVGGVCMVLGQAVTFTAWVFVGPGLWAVELPWGGALEVHKSAVCIFAGSLLGVGFYQCVILAHTAMLADVVPQRGKTVAMALQYGIVSGCGALGAFSGGVLVDFLKRVAPDGFGWELPGGEVFCHMHILVIVQASIGWFVALPLFLRARLPRGKTGFREAFGLMVLSNPLRLAMGVHHGRALAMPLGREKQFRAVEAMTENAAPVALADLAQKTRDPSYEIREAAARALGKIGNAEAVDALVEAATRPDSDIAAAALRALRPCAGPGVATALIPLLSHPNIEVVREAARTLGAARCRDAIEPLLNLLHATRQPAVALAAAEALGLLNAGAPAFHAAVARMRNARNETHHRAFGVNAADLLGSRDLFYKILAAEDHAHGGGLTLLATRILDNAERLGGGKESPLRRRVAILLRNMDRHYMARELRPCAQYIFELAREFSAALYGVEWRGDIRAFLGELEQRDPLFAAGAWYAAVLDGAFQRANTSPALSEIKTNTEALLGVYVTAVIAPPLKR